jgi:predicted RND superfamily exporter protein
MTSNMLDEVFEIATNEPALRDFLIAHEGHTTGVNVTFQMPQLEMTETPETVAAARALAAKLEADYPVKVHLTGMVMLNNAFQEMAMQDLSTMVPAMYGIIVLVAFLLLRSITATIGTVLVILLSLVTAMGLAGWAGIELTPPSSAAPTIIMTLAVADSIHILVSLLSAMRRGVSRRDAVVESLRLNMSPVFLASVTTAIGFLSLNFSDSPPFGDLGNITAVGMLVAFFYSVGFLPAFLAIVPVKSRQGQSVLGKSMDRLGDWVVHRNRPILIGFSACAVLLLAFIPANDLNDDFVAYFDESTTFRSDVIVTTDRLTGAYQLQFSLDSGSSNGVSDPAFLAQVGRFVDWLRGQPEIRHVNSITDTFKRLNKNLHGDDPTYYRLPEQRELAAQYLLLYELSLPYGLDLNNQLNIDKSSTQILVTLENLDSRRLREISERGETWLRDNAPKLATEGIGPAIMFAYISDRNIRSMLVGTLLAVVVISAILVGVLKSPKLGGLSLVPNLLPAGLAFGAWGLFVGEVNMAVSMVSGMTLGIVVDDTIHFLSKYKRGRREQNLDAPDAIRYAFHNVGQAIVVTSLILIAGFSVLSTSDFAMNSLMAMLTAIAMALVADFLLLPALLIKLDGRKTSAASAHAGAAEFAPAP